MFFACLHRRSGCNYRGLRNKMVGQYLCTAVNSLLIDILSTCDLRLAIEQVMAKDQFSWTDNETELLLNTTSEYKTEKLPWYRLGVCFEVLFSFNWENKVLFEVSPPLLRPARLNPEASGLSGRFSNR